MKVLYSLILSVVILVFVGCVTTGNLPHPGVVFNFDVPDKSIKTTIEYKVYTVIEGHKYQTRCAGKVTVHNYGNKDYRGVMLQLSFYDEHKTLIATDTFHVQNGLIAEGSVTYGPDYYNSLDSATPGKVYTRCPQLKDGRLVVTAF
jgi:hypothetical protein